VTTRRVVAALSERRFALLMWFVCALGAATIGIAAATLVARPVPIDRWVVVIAVATLATDTLSLDLRVGRHIESYTWAELNVVLGLVLLTPAQLVLTSLCVAVAYIVTRRAWIKVAFNTASYAIGVTLALLVAHAIAAPAWNHPTRSALALVAGAAAFSSWNSASVDAAIAFSQGLLLREVLRKGALLRLAVCIGNVAVALTIVALAHHNPLALLALPLCFAVAYVCYRSFLRTVQERTVWRQLEAISREINQLDEAAVAEVALRHAAMLLEADEVQLWLYPDGEPAALLSVYVAEAGGGVHVRKSLGVGALNHFEVRTCRALDERSSNGSVDTRVIVPLLGRRTQIGALLVRFDARVRLSDRERQLMRTYAHTISTNIENARLYAAMRDQAARNELAAMHDPLTGLPNRLLLEDRVESLLDDPDRRSFAMMLIDLDHFKDVNDGLGHVAGDALLCEVATRLQTAVRSHDIVCRLGGDEFAILAIDASASARLAERVLSVLTQTMEIHGVRLAVGASIGYACWPADASTFGELLQRADVALYQAKVTRGSFQRYRRDRDASSLDRLSLVAELRAALDDDQLEMHYQPQLELTTGRATGAEALVRWRHPLRGLLEPHHFIRAVESSSLVREFTCRVLDLAIAECARWQRDGASLTVAVNLSARNFDDERLANDIATVLDRHRLHPSRLVLEITETAILGDLDFVEQQIARLSAIGVSLSIDDFGTGSSSLTFLQRIKVNELKIDRSFVAGIVVNDNDAAITRATIRLAQSLGLRTVAEGVESHEVARELVALGCDAAQGYLWSPPVPAREARSLLTGRALLTVSELDLTAANQVPAAAV
jgi:diguanylate cyclase (GGDEF)-like protein